MNHFVWLGPSLLALVSLSGNFVQQRRIASLEERVELLAAQRAGRAAEDEAGLGARVDKLEKQLAWRVTPTVGPATAATAATAAPGAPANTAQVQQLREDVDALLTGEATATEQGKARLRELIADTQKQQWAERQERRDERIVTRLAESARLSPQQREQLTQALADERGRRATLLGSVRTGGGPLLGQPEDVRAQLQALRAETDQKLRTVLDAEQYKQYEAARSFGRGLRGGRDTEGGTAAGPTNPGGPALPGAARIP